MLKRKALLLERNYSTYIYRKELIDDTEYGGKGDLEMVSCYTPSGDYIGNPREARYLCRKRGLIYIQKADPMHCVCSIGYNPKEKKWYGWSHRAICGFGMGDQIFEEDFGDDNTPFKKHGKVTIKTIDEAKQSAIAFAASVS